MELLPFSMEKPAAASTESGMGLSSKSHKHSKELRLTSYSEVISYILETYVTDEIIAEMSDEFLRLKQLSNMMAMDYAEALWNTALPCDVFYGEQVSKRNFLK